MTRGDAVAGTLRAAGVDANFADRLAAYAELVLDANRTMNLTAARTPDAFAEHILDALTVARDIEGPLIDIGAGSGLPGIPLAMVTGARVVLVDAAQRKAVFLARALAELGLPGEAQAQRAETLAHDVAYRERFACATARAVGGATMVAELTLPFLFVGGRALLQRGATTDAERTALADAALMLGGELLEERHVGRDKRVFAIVKRVPTDHRFPRRTGVPEKRPLCAS
ncbi:MAG: 16S rRNA (guanine(527)-N(7))-methyltransferase RsmG [Candidatus Velthaea sp.]